MADNPSSTKPCHCEQSEAVSFIKITLFHRVQSALHIRPAHLLGKQLRDLPHDLISSRSINDYLSLGYP